MAIGEDPDAIDAILITHEHSDHVQGLGPLARKLSKKRRKPVYLSKLTAPAIDWGGFAPIVETFQAGTSFPIGDLEIQSFTIPHDAIDPVGFSVRWNGLKFSVAMDLGYLPASVKYHLRSSHVLVVESNHDLEMLKVGPYPWPVKQRVMGRRGHLSNDLVSDYITEDLDGETQALLLGHLSEHNNHPEIVRLVAAQALERSRTRARLVVAEPKKRSEVFIL